MGAARDPHTPSKGSAIGVCSMNRLLVKLAITAATGSLLFSSLTVAQILGIRPVMHDAIMLVVPPRVRGVPPDNGHPGVSRFELRRFGDLDVLSPLLRRKDLSDDRVGEKHAAGHSGDRQFPEQSIHGTDPNCCSPLVRRRQKYGGRTRPPYLSRSYGIGIEGSGGTPQMSVAQGN